MRDSVKLPTGWDVIAMSKLASINPSKSDVRNLGNSLAHFVPMAKVSEEFGGIDVSMTRPLIEVVKGYTAFRAGDILFAKITPCMENGKVAIVPDLKHEIGFGSTEFHVLRVNELVTPEWVAFFLSQETVRRDARRNMTGSAGQLRVPALWLSEQQVPLAPLPEQRRIVAKIEELFSDLDAGVAALKRAQAKLKRYRAAVLKAAVEGKLTEEWRAQHPAIEPASKMVKDTESPPKPSRYKTRSKDVVPGHAALSVGNTGAALPRTWTWAPLVDIAQMESGHTPSRNHPEWWDGDIPWVGILDAKSHHGGLIYDTLQHTNDAGLANSAARMLPAGTVCVSRTAASIGYVIVLGVPMATSQDFVNWVPTRAITSDWLRLVFMADRNVLFRFGKGSTHKTVYFPEWLSLYIAVPPLAEQKQIVAEVDLRLSQILATEQQLKFGIAQASRLRQSILKQAFEGKLVPQDPNDEPASVLLERLRLSEAVDDRSPNAASPGRSKGRRRNTQKVTELSAGRSRTSHEQ